MKRSAHGTTRPFFFKRSWSCRWLSSSRRGSFREPERSPNWIAEVTSDDETKLGAWFRPVPIETFLHHFADRTWDWLDVPALIRGGEFAFENPMIDRDRVPTWVDGPRGRSVC